MIVVLIGKSGTGKSTIEEHLINRIPNLSRVISDTSRPMRDYEIDGFHYNFLTSEDFYKGIENDEYIEHASFNGWYYGINKKNIDSNDKDYICVTNPEGYYNLRNYFGNKVLGIQLVSTTNERKERYFSRDGFADEEEWNRRLKTDEKDFREVDEDPCVDHIWNTTGSLSQTVVKLIKLINEHRLGETFKIKR